jgi:hypothetical protein
MISVTDQQAADLFRIAHRDDDREINITTEDSGDTTDETDSAETDLATSRDTQETDQDGGGDEDSGVVFDTIIDFLIIFVNYCQKHHFRHNIWE